MPLTTSLTVVRVANTLCGLFHDGIARLAGPQRRKEFDRMKLKSTAKEGLDIADDGEKKIKAYD